MAPGQLRPNRSSLHSPHESMYCLMLLQVNGSICAARSQLVRTCGGGRHGGKRWGASMDAGVGQLGRLLNSRLSAADRLTS